MDQKARDLTRRTIEQSHLFPELEKTPDLRRGETRLAAEVCMTVILGLKVSEDQQQAFEAARLMAFETLRVLAKG